MEKLTDQYVQAIQAILKEVDERGGTVKLIEEGWFQRKIAEDAYETALRKQSGEKPVIGVNRFVEEEETLDLEVHPYDPKSAERQIERTRQVRANRDEAAVRELLQRLKAVARDESQNILPVTVELVRQGASMGDIIETLKQVWGTYRETPVF